MAKRRAAPTSAEIGNAIARAMEGRGRQLALLVKSFSVDDLAAAFSGASYPSAYPYQALAGALAWASGRKSWRDDLNARLREADKKSRRAAKAKDAAGEVAP